jgi:hypothetical protein
MEQPGTLPARAANAGRSTRIHCFARNRLRVLELAAAEPRAERRGDVSAMNALAVLRRAPICANEINMNSAGTGSERGL